MYYAICIMQYVLCNMYYAICIMQLALTYLEERSAMTYICMRMRTL